ncbi:MAG: glycine cleavage system protein GcvH [Peptococcaceae bacterium]|mgnify:FL=1|nr:glycine cleavage system protein GcvH [Peptococcaceae bacterium]
MNTPKELLYSRSHEWIKSQGETAEIGLTDYAQEQMGDIVFVNLPEVGDEVSAGLALGDVESVKAVADVISPVSGRVTEINEELLDSPQLINEKPYEAWLIRVDQVRRREELLDAQAYEAFVVAEEG